MKQKPLAVGSVLSLAVNGNAVSELEFDLSGPIGDLHRGNSRRLGGHDSHYIGTLGGKRGGKVKNLRSWTGLSHEEIVSVEKELGRVVPVGTLLENITIARVPGFSQLEIGTSLVFPHRECGKRGVMGAILMVWEENSPCNTVAERLAKVYGLGADFQTSFIREAQGKRGVMGFVFSAGLVSIGDEVLVYPPNR